jgi:glutaredoxin
MTLKLFTVPGCGECEAVKHFLLQQGVPFQELDIAHSFANLRQLRRLTASRRVPVCARDDCVVVGFDPEALRNLLVPKETLSE